jgi:hypothetical protein
MTQAPWWAAGVFTVIGILLSQVMTSTNNRNRSRFEDARRWHESRREAYANITITASSIHNGIFHHFVLNRELPTDLDEQRKSLEHARGVVLLIGPEEVKETVDLLYLIAMDAVASALDDNADKALNNCGELMGSLNETITLMRADLAGEQVSARQRGFRRPIRWTANR